MKLLRELLIVLGIYFIGELIHNLFKLPLPGNIIAMLLLLFCLCANIIKLQHIENVSKFLLDHLAFFFIPAGVGLITSLNILRGSWYKILLVCFVSTIVVMVVSGKIVQLLIKNTKNKA